MFTNGDREVARRSGAGGYSRCRATAVESLRLALLATLLAAASAIAAGPGLPDEVPAEQLKAAFVYHFAKFTQWPAAAPPTPKILLCRWGDHPMAPYLDALAGRTAGDTPLEIRAVASLDEVTDCRILFVGADHGSSLAGVLAAARDLPVLTIADRPGFAADGGMIELYEAEARVRFAINIEAVRRAGLRIDPHVLKLARIVEAPP